MHRSHVCLSPKASTLPVMKGMLGGNTVYAPPVVALLTGYLFWGIIYGDTGVEICPRTLAPVIKYSSDFSVTDFAAWLD